MSLIEKEKKKKRGTFHSGYCCSSILQLLLLLIMILCNLWNPFPIKTLSTSTSISISPFPITIHIHTHSRFHQQTISLSLSLSFSPSPPSSPIHHDTLRVLEWDKLCDLVASFATTSLGRQALIHQLCSLHQTYHQSLALLSETNAAVEINKHGGCRLHFAHLDSMLVKTAIQRARRSTPVNGYEARAIVALLLCAETLQGDLKAAIKEDKDWYSRFMPLTEVILEFVINRSLVRMIEQVIDDDGSVKDSASPALKQSRQQVQVLERKIQQLMENLIRNEKSETSILEVNNIDGRWCIRMDSGHKTSFKGLLLSSGSGVGSTIEPLSAVPLNDELQRARYLVAKAESDVLLALTQKMQLDLDDIEKILNSLVHLDVINARATYGLSFGGSNPNIFLPDRNDSSTSEALTKNDNPYGLSPNNREWTLYLPKAYHPLLLQRHRENLKKDKKGLAPSVKSQRTQSYCFIHYESFSPLFGDVEGMVSIPGLSPPIFVKGMTCLLSVILWPFSIEMFKEKAILILL
ncbi:hypothetical protein RIF29_17053 [Crotalaria pallida]|uniref:DNA mismatch repair protein MutS core domain-containing protein n=1 Tax=Crotalaria pallida TaxID=3830 RepID=A0AAN9FJV8_CROPI